VAKVADQDKDNAKKVSAVVPFKARKTTQFAHQDGVNLTKEPNSPACKVLKT